MEAKINIVEILKDKPQGTKLYSSACGKCKLEEVNDKSFKISFYNSKFGFMNGGEGYLDKNGKLYDDGECVVFPSKEMRNWSKFAWKKGDVLVNSLGFKLFFDRWANYDYTRFFGKVNLLEDSFSYETEKYTLASKEETLDTLEIEKPEFKDGDIVVAEGENKGKKIFIFRYKIRDSNTDEHGYKSYINVNSDGSLFNNMTFYLRKDFVYRPATDSEKQQLFEALAKKGKHWDAKKKAIVDLPKKCEFKAFDKVLVRDSNDYKWKAGFFSHYSEGLNYPFICVGGGYGQCIPYNEDTKHLLGTTEEWKGGEA